MNGDLISRSALLELYRTYRDFENNVEPSDEQKRFARWVNRKAIFKSVDQFSKINTLR